MVPGNGSTAATGNNDDISPAASWLGSLEKVGLGYEELAQEKPDLFSKQ
jgi:hypothetical protein